jgi:phospholipase/carboxylesterase
VASGSPLTFQARPAAGTAAGALVLLHGRGAGEHDLRPLADALDPGRRLVALLPRGPLALPTGGAHWYVLGGIPTPEPTTFLATMETLSGWLDATLAEHGLDVSRAVLGGFSQGAVMSSALALGRGRPSPAGLVMLSGFLPQVDGYPLDLDRPRLPVTIAHGSLDSVIPVDFGRAARDRLTGAGLDVTYRESPLPHTIDPAVVDELRDSIATLL